jgi:haloalkane dehalogenase
VRCDTRIRVFSAIMGGPIGRTLTTAFNFVPRFFFARGLHQTPDREVRAMYMAPWQARERRRAAAIAPRQLIRASPYLAEVEAGLAKLRDRPALIVWGTQDFAFRDDERARFEDLFPHHETVLLVARVTSFRRTPATKSPLHFARSTQSSAWRVTGHRRRYGNERRTR